MLLWDKDSVMQGGGGLGDVGIHSLEVRNVRPHTREIHAMREQN